MGTWVESRGDAYSMLVYKRRVMPSGAEDIGTWQKVTGPPWPLPACLPVVVTLLVLPPS